MRSTRIERKHRVVGCGAKYARLTAALEGSVHVRADVQFLGGVDHLVRRDLEGALAGAGVETARASDREAAVVLFAAHLEDVPPAAVRASSDGGRRCALVVRLDPDGDARPAWRLLRAGALDVVPWDGDAPARSAERIGARLRRWREVAELVSLPEVSRSLVGRSPALLATLHALVEAARVSGGTVLITGESGTGKELAAGLVHALDPREGKGRMVVVDCTTIVPALAGSELFGHERGAFTDAVTSREGAFAEADGGTLFLDELGELPLRLQAELLRVVQEKTYKRVGSGTWRRTQFRLVCATNRDLAIEAEQGRFRSDLYHRVAAWSIRMPALRERREDIPVLADHFLALSRPDLDPPRLDVAVREVLENRPYPGNVRELKQLMGRLAARHVGPGPITVGDLPVEERPEREEEPSWTDGDLEQCVRRALAQRARLRDIGRAAEETAIAVALQEAEGNVRRASQRLGITDRALQLRRASARLRVARQPAAGATPWARAEEPAPR